MERKTSSSATAVSRLLDLRIAEEDELLGEDIPDLANHGIDGEDGEGANGGQQQPFDRQPARQ